MLARSLLKFGPFEVDPALGELRKDGLRVPIQEKPLRLLAALAERQGELVTRAELHQHLWQGEAFVDFDNGLNTAVRKLRVALGDESESPRYIETVPRRGYRFLAPVETLETGADQTGADRQTIPAGDEASSVTVAAMDAPNGVVVAGDPPPATEIRGTRVHHRIRSAVVVCATVLAVMGATAVWLNYSRPVLSFNSRDSVLIVDFENQTGDPRFDQALQTAFTISLEQSRHANIFPRARLGSVLEMMGKTATERVTPALGREICQREGIRGLITASITRTGDEYALSAELVDPQSGDTVRSYSERSYGESHILDALDVVAADIREDLGETLYQIHESTKPLPEVTTSSLDALREFADGSELWHQARYLDAMTLYRAAVQADPDFAMAHAALGSAYYSYISNEPQKGDEEFQKALALASRTTQRERMEIQVDYADSQGHFEEADRLYQIYLKRYPDDWIMLLDYARLLRTHGHADQAIGQYKEMLRMYPDDPRTLVELATANSTLGLTPAAIGAYNRAFEIDPAYLSSGDVGREYGMALIENGEAQKAEEVFKSQLGDSRTRANGLRSLALLDLYYGRYESARPMLEEALAYYEGLKTAQLSVVRVRLLLAILAEGEGDVPAERRQLDSAMANFDAISSKVIVGAWIGSEYARAGFAHQAEQIESTVAPTVDKENPEQLAYEHFSEGEIALLHGDDEKAVQLFSLSDQEKTTPFSMEGMARAYQASGNMAMATSQYEKYIASSEHGLLWEPQQRWLAAHYTLASDYLAMGNREKAREALNPLLLLWKDADQNLPLRKQALALSARLQ
jgi:eukaryotic-like serine/threonine-protein kinase